MFYVHFPRPVLDSSINDGIEKHGARRIYQHHYRRHRGMGKLVKAPLHLSFTRLLSAEHIPLSPIIPNTLRPSRSI